MQAFPKEFLKKFLTFSAKATFVFILVLATVGLGLGYYFQQLGLQTDPRTFTIEGTAEREVQPDNVLISVGAIEEGNNALTVQNNVNKKINQATEEIKALGIEEGDIKTTRYDVSPKYDWESGKITGYTANVELTVTVKGVMKEDKMTGDVIEQSALAGLNDVRSLRYEIENRDDILEELKLEAIEDGKKKKDSYVQATGIRLGKLKDVNLGGGYTPYRGGFSESAVAFDETKAMAEVDVEQVTILPGETELSVTVTLYYEIL